jgi:hypothetical protein
MSRRADALQAYREAEALLDEVVAMVPFGEGRASAAADGGESVRRAAAILVDPASDGDPHAQREKGPHGGRAGEALDMIRHARGRLVRSLSTSTIVAALEGPSRERWEHAVAEYRDARAAIDSEAEGDWKKSRAALDAALLVRSTKLAALQARLDDAMQLVPRTARDAELPPLPASETALAFAYVGAKREIVGFVSLNGATRAFRVGALGRETPSARLGELLLRPAATEIERATRIRVLTDDALAWIDVHALPLDGSPLVARAPVVYGVDLAVRAPDGADGKRPLAVIVADPTGDLPSAREEGKAVTHALGSAIEVRSLVGREATALRVREAIERASLFHYAGHGVFRGREGVDSALPLAQGGALTLADVFTLDRGPRTVVLSGCEAGRQQGAAEEAAASMAQAFLVAGASTVVAPARLIDDRAAGALTTELHVRASDAGASYDLAEALRRAQLHAVQDGRIGWDAFRAFVR